MLQKKYALSSKENHINLTTEQQQNAKMETKQQTISWSHSVLLTFQHFPIKNSMLPVHKTYISHSQVLFKNFGKR